MNRIANSGPIFSSTPVKEAYLIFRVFHLEHDEVGLRVYMNPLALLAQQKLQFTIDKWSVRPGRKLTAEERQEASVRDEMPASNNDNGNSGGLDRIFPRQPLPRGWIGRRIRVKLPPDGHRDYSA